MNQDGIENFFGCVKSFCRINVNPNVRNFRAGYTTAILNNVTGKSSVRSNCEKDSSTNLLNDMHELVLKYNERLNDHNVENDDDVDMLEIRASDPLFVQDKLNFAENIATSEISSSACRQLLQTIKCKNCKNNLQTHTNNADSAIVSSSKNFKESFQNVFNDVDNAIPGICFVKSIKKDFFNSSKEHTLMLVVLNIKLKCHSILRSVL